MTEVHIVIAEGGTGDHGLLDKAALKIEAVFARREDAERYSTMGDMEVHTWTVAESYDDDSEEAPVNPG
jgi:hypothetical protein